MKLEDDVDENFVICSLVTDDVVEPIGISGGV